MFQQNQFQYLNASRGMIKTPSHRAAFHPVWGGPCHLRRQKGGQVFDVPRRVESSEARPAAQILSVRGGPVEAQRWGETDSRVWGKSMRKKARYAL